jgi:hypothetical protein
VSVVLPCLDEAASITGCVDEARLGLRNAGLEGEVLVVDNGSADESAELATRAGARVVAEPHPGYGSALRRGIDEARGDVVVMADADGTYDLARLGELAEPVLDGSADIVLGSRLAGMNRGTMPLLHRLVGTPAISFALRRVCPGLRIRDSQSGYRAFGAAQVRQLNLRATGMEFASEMLIRASRDGLRISERPIGYRPRIGESKLSALADGWRHLQLILLLAPQVLLVWPGVFALVLGIALSALSLAYPVGFDLGTLRWQPIFLAPVLISLGTLASLAGAVVAYHSALADRSATRYGFVGHPKFWGRCITAGVAGLGAGVALDVVLFAIWVSDGSSPSQALALAGIAQALVITGVIVAGSGILYRILVMRGKYHSGASADILPFRIGVKAPAAIDRSTTSSKR